ncbi:DUF1330 domain-containing protein [Actinomadura kijaniata]|uniref:Uncharacterized protein (DUF1330 family) n=1 Tax=Actinomadura namibiensis TaxID=182080 RepID=A0A7W3QKZ7_ACTNM|nr:DUF1330 domain-containing protein [Actinomadura namibiensis]MBA8950937.1 uncharacterized protein (DUF1330 family) [Actinomadura namibiensis]
MPAYAMAHLRPTEMPNDEVLEYIERIQATMDPFGGRFLVHGSEVEAVEGTFEGAFVMIEFPDRDAIHAWYASEAYQEILPLRARNIPGDVWIAEGVPEGYDARRTAAKLRAARG